MNNISSFPEVCVVEASAGSGKTYALAKRYLYLLINPRVKLNLSSLRSILAITFTNKATVEMKERILEFLKKIALDAFSDAQEEADIFAALQVDKQFAGRRAHQIMDELIRHYNFFQIQTIDSFINALLLGSALNINRSASFKIKRDYSRCLAYCLDLVIDQAADNSQVLNLLEEFLDYYLFVENRGGWFPKEDIEVMMKSLFKLSNKYGKVFIPYAGESKDIIKKKKHIFRRIKELVSVLPPGLNKSARNSLEKFIQNNNDIFEAGSLPKFLQRAEIPLNKNTVCPPAVEKKWEDVRRRIKEMAELEAVLIYNPYVKLFHRLFDCFQVVSQKQDVLFLEELNRQARRLFDKEGLTVAELYYRLAARFSHYLIDEFQDTSVLQWDNLAMMIEDALAGGGSLFYVGDRKQAIYRFRGGEAKLFDEVKDKFAHFNVKPAHLTKNWRSQKAIVEFNNKIFSRENLSAAFNLAGISEELKVEPGAEDEILDIFLDARQQYKPGNEGGYVGVECLEEENQTQRDEIVQAKLLALIARLKERFSYEDIAVLTRDNKEVELVTAWLLAAGYPVESEKTLGVMQNSLIKEIIAFLKFLHSPIDDLSFAAFILGDIFSQAAGIGHEEITNFIFTLHKEKQLNGAISLYHLFRQQYGRIWQEYIEDFFKNVGFISPYELVSGIYQRFKVLSNFLPAQGFFMKLLELLTVKEDEYAGLEEFFLYLENAPAEDLYVDISRRDSVKILTIHKAKGLEFGVVIIPFLRMDINPETGGKDTSSYVVPRPQDSLGLLRITKNHWAYSPFLHRIYVQSYKEACIDELNNIYVALTRAQFELYVFIPKKSAAAGNKARALIPQGLVEQGSREIYARREKAVQPLINISPSVYKDWIEFFKDEFADRTKISNRPKVLQGNIYHALLSQIGNCSIEDKEKLLQGAVKYTQQQFPYLEDLSSYEGKIRRLLEDKELKDIFYVSDGQIFCEKEVANKFGDLKRIDRLIVRDKEAAVVDYKSTDADREVARRQVEEYMQIVGDIYPQHQVKGLIVYIEEEKREEVL